MGYLELHSITIHAHQYLSEAKHLYDTSSEQEHEYITNIQLSDRLLQNAYFVWNFRSNLFGILDRISLRSSITDKDFLTELKIQGKASEDLSLSSDTDAYQAHDLDHTSTW